MLSFVEVEQAVKQMSDDQRQQLQALLETLSENPQSAKLDRSRQTGLFSGIWMSDDFNDELPDSFW
jgi:tripartite-type tricarboxylate transporter receptor subunit TctC